MFQRALFHPTRTDVRQAGVHVHEERKVTHEETYPESAKDQSGQVAPTCRAWLHGSVSKAAAAEYLSMYAHVAPHATQDY